MIGEIFIPQMIDCLYTLHILLKGLLGFVSVFWKAIISPYFGSYLSYYTVRFTEASTFFKGMKFRKFIFFSLLFFLGLEDPAGLKTLALLSDFL